MPSIGIFQKRPAILRRDPGQRCRRQGNTVEYFNRGTGFIQPQHGFMGYHSHTIAICHSAHQVSGNFERHGI